MFPNWSLSPKPQKKSKITSSLTLERDDNFTDFKQILKEDENFDIMDKRRERRKRMKRRKYTSGKRLPSIKTTRERVVKKRKVKKKLFS